VPPRYRAGAENCGCGAGDFTGAAFPGWGLGTRTAPLTVSAGNIMNGEARLAADVSRSIADELVAHLAVSPEAYPQKVDLVREAVLLVKLDAAAFRAASFLDDRILGPTTPGAWIRTDLVDAASRGARNLRPLHFIFHTGHVGSTLASRLLDDTGEVLSLREPLPLRSLADVQDTLDRNDSLLSPAQFELMMAMFVRLWARGHATTRGVVVKATSSAGRVAVPLLARSKGSRAIYMNLRPEPYLATILAGQNSYLDLRGHGPERVRRLGKQLAAPIEPLHALSIGELAALSWLAEALAQRDALNVPGGRVIAVDFDQFLAHVEAGMRTILGHFELGLDERYLATVAGSNALKQYSKAPEFAYTPDFRAQVLRESRRNNRDEIRKGMEWLARQARNDATVAALVL
jgi:hypothetical protein